MAARPPITIRCECDEERSVPYGQTWTCESCGRHWDTRQIPEAEYAARIRRIRLFRAEPLGLLALTAAVFVPLIVFVNAGFVLLAGVTAFAFILFYMPFWRRRIRRALHDAPTWELRPQ